MKNFFLILCCFLVITSCEKIHREVPGLQAEYFKGTAVYELAKAVRNDDISKIKKILKDKTLDLNARDKKNGCTILMYTVYYSKNEAVKILLENGANPNVSDNRYDQNALILAIEKKGKYTDCETELIELLIKYGGDVNSKQEYRFTMDNGGIDQANASAVAIASSGGCLNIVKLLVDRGAKCSLEKDSTNTAITSAILQGNLDIVKYFIVDKKVDVPKYAFIRPDNKGQPTIYVTVEMSLIEESYEGDVKNQKLKQEILNYLEKKRKLNALEKSK